MIGYVDTSAVVKLLVDEDDSERARRTWRSLDRIISSVLVYPETAAALAAARRAGRLDAASHRLARDGLEAIWGILVPIACTNDVIRLAATLAEDEGLRGYDAVHLASALVTADDEPLFLCFDEELAEAAWRNGLAVAA